MKKTVTGTPNGYYALDGELLIDGTELYADGMKIADVSDSRKTFATLGMYTVILPDKVYYNRLTKAFGHIESTLTGEGYIENGTYAGEEAEANTCLLYTSAFFGAPLSYTPKSP